MTHQRSYKGMGLRESVDMRDSLYPMRTHLSTVTALPEYKFWQRGEILDQGREGACVGFGWTAWFNCKPTGYYRQRGDEYARNVYRDAQLIDEWHDTPPEEGTSVRAGARAMLARETLTEYLWAYSVDDVRAWLLSTGPVVIGAKWTEGMFDTNANGYIKPTGYVSGGHCVMLYGAAKTGDIFGQNSWGPDWGREGTFRISRDDLDALISMGGFVACTARHTSLGNVA